jgi:hypothetical protein
METDYNRQIKEVPSDINPNEIGHFLKDYKTYKNITKNKDVAYKNKMKKRRAKAKVAKKSRKINRKK